MRFTYRALVTTEETDWKVCTQHLQWPPHNLGTAASTFFRLLQSETWGPCTIWQNHIWMTERSSWIVRRESSVWLPSFYKGASTIQQVLCDSLLQAWTSELTEMEDRSGHLRLCLFKALCKIHRTDCKQPSPSCWLGKSQVQKTILVSKILNRSRWNKCYIL